MIPFFRKRQWLSLFFPYWFCLYLFFFIGMRILQRISKSYMIRLDVTIVSLLLLLLLFASLKWWGVIIYTTRTIPLPRRVHFKSAGLTLLTWLVYKMFATQLAGAVEYTDGTFASRTVFAAGWATSIFDMTINKLMVKLQLWSFGECGVLPHCNYSQVHFDLVQVK